MLIILYCYYFKKLYNFGDNKLYFDKQHKNSVTKKQKDNKYTAK